MTFGFESFWDLVGAVASIAQILTVTAAMIVIVRAKRRWEQLIKVVETPQEGVKAAAIAVGIGGSIEGAVRAYLDKAMPNREIPLVAVERNHHLKPSECHSVLHELLALKQKLMDKGVTEVHLFYRGPVTLAMGIGAILDNWVPVAVYELDKESGIYKRVLTLDKGAVYGLNVVDDVLTEGEQVIIENMMER